MQKRVRFVFAMCVALSLLVPVVVSAQDEPEQPVSNWKFSGNAALTFNQVALSNWVAGGQNSLSGGASAFFGLDYKQDRMVWNNALKLGYGLIRQGEDPVLKNEDLIDFNSKFGYKAGGAWYYSLGLGLKTQFAPGYKDAKSEVKISDAFAPLYLLLSLGADYKPDDHFSLLLSPASGRMTYVRSQMLADRGAFGVKKADVAPDGRVVTPGQHVRWEMGAFLKATYTNSFFKDMLGLNTSLELFSNYLDKPQNIDVNFDIALDYKLSNWLTARAQVTMIYDDDMRIKLDDGRQVARLQVRQMFGIGLAYRF